MLPHSGEFIIVMFPCDKRRVRTKLPARMLLHISIHATEALFQRLRTQDAGVVQAELRPIGAWLLENLDAIGLEGEGYLLSPSGVFPIAMGKPFRSERLLADCFWDATTWIADTGLSDNSELKRRIAEAVRQARSQGMQVGLVYPGIGT